VRARREGFDICKRKGKMTELAFVEPTFNYVKAEGNKCQTEERKKGGGDLFREKLFSGRNTFARFSDQRGGTKEKKGALWRRRGVSPE